MHVNAAVELLATFGNLGGFDGIFIFLVLLLVFGARRFPNLAKDLDLAMLDFSKLINEVRHLWSWKGLAILVLLAVTAWAVAQVCLAAFVH
jgi:mttA/Hcf106 family protein